MSFTTELKAACRRNASRVAFVDEHREVTYGELASRARRLANGLSRLGVAKGDRVLLAMGNSISSYETEFAASLLGAPRVSVLRSCTATEIAKYIELTEPAVVICDEMAAEACRAGIREMSSPAALVVQNAAGPSSADESSGELDYQRLVSESPDEEIAVDVTDDDIYAIRFTGGTTGDPKGVVMDHRCMMRCIYSILINWEISADDTCLHVHPVTHASGFIGYAHWWRGARNVLLPEFGMTPKKFFASVEEYRASCVFMVPTLLYVLMDSDEMKSADYSSLKRIIYGAAPIMSSRLRQGLSLFGPVFTALYGSSESPFVVTTLQPDEHVFDGEPPNRLKSVGRPGIGIELLVRREDGSETDPDEIGEVVVRGDNTMHGYWRNDEMTRARKIDGWVYTGDLGYIDTDGYVYLVDRREDMIITGGFNVWPSEVESVLVTHPAVQEAVVVGVPDDHWGEAVVAVVISRSPVASEELLEHCRKELVRYKVPKQIHFREEPLPKSAVGKILRRHVRDEVRS